jgi:hypothetical protein
MVVVSWYYTGSMGDSKDAGGFLVLREWGELRIPVLSLVPRVLVLVYYRECGGKPESWY